MPCPENLEIDGLRHKRSPARVLTELVVGYSLILLAIWTPGAIQRAFMFAAACWIIATSLPGSSTVYGLRLSRLRQGWWIIAAAVVLAGGAAVFAACIGTLQIPFRYRQNPGNTTGYIIWSFVQQFILQDFVLLRLRRLLPSARAAVLAAAILFSLAHLPNPLLTAAAFFWGIASCALFLRYGDLYSLGAAHAIFGLCLTITIPDAVDHQMRVGLGYLRYQPPATTHSARPP